MSWEILEGDCRTVLAELPERSFQTCVTSPPYFGLRDYGHAGQSGLEPTPHAFAAALVAVFREVRRVLRDDGTVWLNLGDSYNNTASGANGTQSTTISEGRHDRMNGRRKHLPDPTLKPKDLLGIPWMVAFALRADGWYLRSEIIWHKPNPMPESVRDRPTKAHEQLFLLSKSPRYFYDADAVREDSKDWSSGGPGVGIKNTTERYGNGNGGNDGLAGLAGRYKAGAVAPGRNRRSVWTVTTQPYKGAHFATFPPKLIEPCILAGCPEGGSVLDPFAGAGTTGLVALRHGRSFIGVELNPEYARMARDRITADITARTPVVPAQLEMPP
jgi:DNA modification methylase